MRLIHVVPAISEEGSGPSYSVLRLCESLASHGEEVILACLDWAPMPSAPSFVKAFPLGVGPRRLGRSPSLYRWLSAQCASGTVGILHNHGMWQFNALYPAWVSQRGRAALVHSPRGALSDWAMSHGSRAKRAYWPLLQRPALRRASCIHATSEAECQDIRRLGFQQPIAMIPNGIDVPALHVGSQGRRATVLFLSRIHRSKGLEILLHAWKEVQEQFETWNLEIAGSDDGYFEAGGYANELRSLAAALQLKRVAFLGARYGAEKRELYQRSSIFVLPTYSENFGVVVAEALAMGIPAIVSKGAPWSGLASRGAGWWIDQGVAPLVACLRDAMGRSSAELASMGARGREWMKRDFSWMMVAGRMMETYRWLLDRSLPVPAWVRLD